MNQNMKLLQREVASNTIRAAATAMSRAVAVTDSELIAAKAGPFGWGSKLERYPLSEITAVRFQPNPHSSLLTVQLNGKGPELTFMFEPGQDSDVQSMVQLLQRCTRDRG
jgi:hypothetical protein